MKTKIAYWLLARFPRPVAVFYAMLVQAAIDNADKLILVLWAAGIVVFYLLFGLAGGTGCVVVPIVLVFIGLLIEEIVTRYNKFDEALPKREKKDKEE